MFHCRGRSKKSRNAYYQRNENNYALKYQKNAILMVHRVWRSFLKLRYVSSLESTLDRVWKRCDRSKMTSVRRYICIVHNPIREGDAMNMTLCSCFSWNYGVIAIVYKNELLHHLKKRTKQNKER